MRLRTLQWRTRPQGSRQRGISTIEAALVLPLILLILFGIIEFGGLFFVRNSMLNAARESARALAVRDITEGEAEAIARDRLTGMDIDFTVNVTAPPDDDPDDRDCIVEIVCSKQEASLGDPLRLMGGGDMRVRVVMRKEE